MSNLKNSPTVDELYDFLNKKKYINLSRYSERPRFERILGKKDYPLTTLLKNIDIDTKVELAKMFTSRISSISFNRNNKTDIQQIFNKYLVPLKETNIATAPFIVDYNPTADELYDLLNKKKYINLSRYSERPLFERILDKVGYQLTTLIKNIDIDTKVELAKMFASRISSISFNRNNKTDIQQIFNKYLVPLKETNIATAPFRVDQNKLKQMKKKNSPNNNKLKQINKIRQDLSRIERDIQELESLLRKPLMKRQSGGAGNYVKQLINNANRNASKNSRKTIALEDIVQAIKSQQGGNRTSLPSQYFYPNNYGTYSIRQFRYGSSAPYYHDLFPNLPAKVLKGGRVVLPPQYFDPTQLETYSQTKRRYGSSAPHRDLYPTLKGGQLETLVKKLVPGTKINKLALDLLAYHLNKVL